MEQEFAIVDKIHEDKTLDEVEFVEKVVSYLLTTNHILYDAQFRIRTLRNIQSVVNNPTYLRIKPLLIELLQKIQQTSQEVANHIPKSTKVLGKGGYGCVVQPALPNRINGKWINYDNNVSKLYFRKNNAVKGLKNSKMIYKYLKNSGHTMKRQKLTYKGSNLSPTTQKNCNINPTDVLISARMPYLGISIADSFDRYKEFRSIPVGIVFGQMLKLFQQVYAIYEQGYVHGDIREPNIMVNLNNGAFTLIDFDWYMPKNEFFVKYKNSLGFYSNPPETLLYNSIANYIRGEPLEYKENAITIQSYVLNSNKYHLRRGITVESVREANLHNLRQFSTIDTMHDYFDIMFASFDSYGLGFTLLEFCEQVYPYGFQMATRFADQGLYYTAEEQTIVDSYLKKLYETVLFPMTNLIMKKRITIQMAYANMKRLHDDFEADVRGLTSNNLERFAKRTEIIENYKPKGTKTRKHKK